MKTVKALTIAGSDPSGGAGIQADLKSFSASGAYGMSVITALTAQSTQGVRGVFPVPVDFVRQQMDTLLDDITPDATKVGMVASTELAAAIGEYLPRLANTIFDPVMVATSGDRLVDEDAVDAVRDLCMKADLITPNLQEAAVLLDCDVATTLDEATDQGKELLARGMTRVLIKGGHLTDTSTDVLIDGDGVSFLKGTRVDTQNTHGTGCTLSSAIAARRPRTDTWVDAIAQAKDYLTRAILAADSLDGGRGHGPVHHFVDLWNEES